MYRILTETTQKAPEKTNDFFEFVKNQPIIFGISVGLLVLALTAVILFFIISTRKTTRK